MSHRTVDTKEGDAKVKRTAVRVYDELDGEVLVGHIEGKTFYRTVDPDQMLATRKAYALHDKVLDQLVDEGVEVVVLMEPSRRLTSTIDDWQDLGQDYAGPRGPQRSLSTSFMGVQ
jgi:hypothetical protein